MDDLQALRDDGRLGSVRPIRTEGEPEPASGPFAGRAARPAGFVELCPWSHLTGDGGVTIVQPRRQWAECSAFEDAYIYFHVAAITRATISVQTSIIDEAEYFEDMATYLDSYGSGQRLSVVRLPSATTPLRRFVRWSVTDASGWNVTLRILALFKA